MNTNILLLLLCITPLPIAAASAAADVKTKVADVSASAAAPEVDCKSKVALFNGELVKVDARNVDDPLVHCPHHEYYVPYGEHEGPLSCNSLCSICSGCSAERPKYVREALRPVYGDRLAEDIAPLVSEFAVGPHVALPRLYVAKRTGLYLFELLSLPFRLCKRR